MEVLIRRSSPVIRRLPPAKPERQLPPRVPETLPELDEASALLGAYLQVAAQPNSKMKASRLARLQELVGKLPSSPEIGREWKSALKELRGELAECELRACKG